MFEVINRNMQAMDGKLTQVIEELKKTKQENIQLRERVEKQEGKIESLEREIRKKNLVLRGVEENEREGSGETVDKVAQVVKAMGVGMEVQQDIDEVRRIGKPRDGVIRPILLKLTTINKKWEILGQSKKLRGTDIWVDEDYTKEVIEERKILYPQVKMARENGHRAFIKHNKLIIDGEAYKGREWETKQQRIREEEGKRKMEERSPEANKLGEQLRKIARTTKNQEHK